MFRDCKIYNKSKVLSKVGRYEFLAEPFHCDFSNRLFMGHLGNHMLNAADFHSNDRGFGMHYLNTIQKTWVLSRLAIEMTEMPEAYDRFHVETWVESAMRFFTNRNFRVVADTADGEKVYGYGRSVWAMIDTETRQPTDILAIKDGSIRDYIEAEKTCPIQKSSRVKMGPDAKLVRTIDTQYSDVDINGHINSVKYIEHVLDLWNLEWYKQHCIRRFEIAYVAEAHQGDRLSFYMEHTPSEEADSGHEEQAFSVRIVKETEDGCEPVETCRSHVVFVTHP
jgi:acyl-ACP thioesterase